MGDVNCQYDIGGGHPLPKRFTSIEKAAINISMRYILEGNGHVAGLCELYHFKPGSLGAQYLNNHGYVHGCYIISRDYCKSNGEMATASAPPLKIAVRGATPEYYESKGYPRDWAPKILLLDSATKFADQLSTGNTHKDHWVIKLACFEVNFQNSCLQSRSEDRNFY
jgi:hypothetical protein